MVLVVTRGTVVGAPKSATVVVVLVSGIDVVGAGATVEAETSEPEPMVVVTTPPASVVELDPELPGASIGTSSVTSGDSGLPAAPLHADRNTLRPTAKDFLNTSQIVRAVTV